MDPCFVVVGIVNQEQISDILCTKNSIDSFLSAVILDQLVNVSIYLRVFHSLKGSFNNTIYETLVTNKQHSRVDNCYIID